MTELKKESLMEFAKRDGDLYGKEVSIRHPSFYGHIDPILIAAAFSDGVISGANWQKEKEQQLESHLQQALVMLVEWAGLGPCNCEGKNKCAYHKFIDESLDLVSDFEVQVVASDIKVVDNK